jgi:hypothetical protein
VGPAVTGAFRFGCCSVGVTVGDRVGGAVAGANDGSLQVKAVGCSVSGNAVGCSVGSGP